MVVYDAAFRLFSEAGGFDQGKVRVVYPANNTLSLCISQSTIDVNGFLES